MLRPADSESYSGAKAPSPIDSCRKAIPPSAEQERDSESYSGAKAPSLIDFGLYSSPKSMR